LPALASLRLRPLGLALSPAARASLAKPNSRLTNVIAVALERSLLELSSKRAREPLGSKSEYNATLIYSTSLGEAMSAVRRKSSLALEYLFAALAPALLALAMFSYYAEVAGTPAYPESPLDVTVETLDRNFNPKTTFYTGETVYFKVTAIGRTGYYYDTYWYAFTEPTTYFVFLQIKNPRAEYIFLFVDPNRVVNPGETSIETPGWWVPYGSPEGTYTVTVYLTNGWPAEVAVWIAYAYDSTTFEVRG